MQGKGLETLFVSRARLYDSLRLSFPNAGTRYSASQGSPFLSLLARLAMVMLNVTVIVHTRVAPPTSHPAISLSPRDYIPRPLPDSRPCGFPRSPSPYS